MNKDFPYVRWNIDTARHNLRPILHAFPKASYALIVLVLNFCLRPELAISMGANRFKGKAVGHGAASRALGTLVAGGYVEMWLDYGTDAKRPRVYRRTARFESAFRMRVNELRAPDKALDADYAFDLEHDGTPLASIEEMEGYAALASAARLSVSDGTQVTRRIWLSEIDSTLHAHGDAPYQTLPKGKRRLLLIDGFPTAEIDYPAMHFNRLLNWCGLPTDALFYEHAMGQAGIELTDGNRAAFKLPALSALNCGSIRSFARACTGSAKRPTRLRVTDKASPDCGRRFVDILGVRPKDLRDAIVGYAPGLAPCVCAQDCLWIWLQAEAGAIMASALKDLAGQGILGLPETDSVIVQARHVEQARDAMRIAYLGRTGFAIQVR